MPVAFLETGSRMHIFGDTLGLTMIVRGALHIYRTSSTIGGGDGDVTYLSLF